jgi:SAM-dependent methyltransferase
MTASTTTHDASATAPTNPTTMPLASDPTSVGGPVDEDRVAAFEDRLVGILNDSALSLMISLGHRTGLFDAIARLGPVGIDELAERAGLRPRYVAEWLGAMTVGRIVDHDPATATYALPAEHAQLLTRSAPEANLAVFAQYIPMLGAVEDDIVTAFHEGGGVGYDAFPRFHAIMEEDSAQTVLAALRDDILTLVPGLTGRLERGIRAIDVGCGRGRALNQLAAWFPNSTFVGYDLSEEAIGYASETATTRGLDNVRFEVADAVRLADIEAPGRAQLVTTFDAVHDQADPAALVRGIRRVLADDGVYLAQDIDASSTHHGDLDHPLGPLLYAISCMHCMTVSLARGGEGLGTMWGRRRARELFRAAGFTEVEVHTLEHDVQNAYYVCRP